MGTGTYVMGLEWALADTCTHQISACFENGLQAGSLTRRSAVGMRRSGAPGQRLGLQCVGDAVRAGFSCAWVRASRMRDCSENMLIPKCRASALTSALPAYPGLTAGPMSLRPFGPRAIARRMPLVFIRVSAPQVAQLCLLGKSKLRNLTIVRYVASPKILWHAPCCTIEGA